MDFMKRNLVFISHANPDDNSFTIWLSTRLKLLGYEVWSDVTNLYGGEKWWNDIEDAIQNYTCKFILVITKNSLYKPGVIREINYAKEAEALTKIQNFIIPIIIDETQFTGLPHGMSDINIIPFNKGWAAGLAKLESRLKEDSVPKTVLNKNLGQSLQGLYELTNKIEKSEEIHTTNLVDVNSYPLELKFYRIPVKATEFQNRLVNMNHPWFEWNSMVVTFADAKSIESCLSYGMAATPAPGIQLDALLHSKPRNHAAFPDSEVNKKLNYLLTEGWNRTLLQKGLHVYEMANQKKAWFFPALEEYQDYLRYVDSQGKVRKRTIQGYSPANEVYWHFAVEMIPAIGKHPRVYFYPHVVFTEDGRIPLSDKAKMHRLRTGFCRNWWNDVWRDRLLLFLQLISKGGDHISLVVGENASFLLASKPFILSAPVRLVKDDNCDQPNDTIADDDVKVDFAEILDDEDFSDE